MIILELEVITMIKVIISYLIVIRIEVSKGLSSLSVPIVTLSDSLVLQILVILLVLHILVIHILVIHILVLHILVIHILVIHILIIEVIITWLVIRF